MSDLQVPAIRRYYWSVRRELWENQSIYLAPIIVAGLVLAGFGISLFGLPARIRAASSLGPDELRRAVEQPFVTAAIVLMAVDLLVAVFYCVDALYGERKDRSILFWKSLPVSDLTTVLAKASIPVVVLPVVTFCATVVTQGLMLLASAVVLAANGTGTGILWTHLPFLEMCRINLSHLLLFHGLWYAPLYAWLLLASAWATRLPFLWATLPPVAIGVVERIAFDSTHFATLVRVHLIGDAPSPGSPSHASDMSMSMLAPHPLWHLLATPELWVGLLLSGLFVLAAVRLRRLRGAI
jgi:ABC-2 type transport system permease protein